MIGGYDPDRGANVAGHRGYYLTGPGLALNQALIAYGLSFLRKKEYKMVQTPYMMNKDIMAKVAQLSEFDEALYKVRAMKTLLTPSIRGFLTYLHIFQHVQARLGRMTPLMNLRHLTEWELGAIRRMPVVPFGSFLIKNTSYRKL